MKLFGHRFPFTLTILSLSFFHFTTTHGDTPQASCNIEFVGSSTIGDFPGEVSGQDFDVQFHDNLWDWDIQIPVNEIDTYNSIQNKKMSHMFDSENFPFIEGNFRNMSTNGEEDAITFVMTIKDIKKNIVAKVSNWKTNETNVSFDLNFPILLKDFKLKRPSFLGILKVVEKVDTTAHFTIYLPSQLQR
ncbi:MAG: hypothetical protein ACI9S8_001007 [Chlamydiales bacterium]|jgi:hypothetical protein